MYYEYISCNCTNIYMRDILMSFFGGLVVGVGILQKIPMHENIAESSDSGKPIVLTAPKSRQAEAYRELAENVIIFLNKQEMNEE